MSETLIIPVVLSNGKQIKVEATPIHSGQQTSKEQDVAEFNVQPFQAMVDAIEGIAGSIAETLQKVKPDKAAIEFALEVGVEAGSLTALIVKGTGKGNLKITLSWGK